MAGADQVLPPPPLLFRRLARLCFLTAAVAGCWLLLSSRQPHQQQQEQQRQQHWQHKWQDEQQHEYTTGGRYRGRPLRDMWAPGLPETAWFSDSQCRHLVTRFTCDGCVDTARLASFPRSGSSWLRRLVEMGTGMFTSGQQPLLRQYRQRGELRLNTSQLRQLADGGEMKPPRTAFLGEEVFWTQGNTIVANTHVPPQPRRQRDEGDHPDELMPFRSGGRRRAVLMIRDPFEVFIAVRMHAKSKSGTSNSADVRELFSGDDWVEFVRVSSQRWYDMYSRWLAAADELHVMRYELLVRNRTAMPQFEALLGFLKVTPDPARMACLERSLEGGAITKQQVVVPDERTYPKQLREHVWSQISVLNEELKLLRRAGLPLKWYSFADEFLNISQ